MGKIAKRLNDGRKKLFNPDNRRTTLFHIVAIGLFCVGAVIVLNYVSPPYQQAELLKKHPQIIEKNATEQLYRPIPLRGASYGQDAVRFDVVFERGFAIANEGIKYRASAIADNPNNIEEIALIFPPTANAYDKTITKDEAYQEVVNLREGKRVIELLPTSSPPFTKESDITFYFEQDVHVTGFVFKKDKPLEIIDGGNDVIFKVYPITSKLEVEASVATIEQSAKQDNATLAQNISNNQILALTWLGIAAIPMLIGADILLRVHLDNHKPKSVNNQV